MVNRLRQNTSLKYFNSIIICLDSSDQLTSQSTKGFTSTPATIANSISEQTLRLLTLPTGKALPTPAPDLPGILHQSEIYLSMHNFIGLFQKFVISQVFFKKCLKYICNFNIVFYACPQNFWYLNLGEIFTLNVKMVFI